MVQPGWLHFWQKPRAVRLTGNQIEIRTVASSQDSQGLYLLGRPYQGAMQVFHPKSKTFSPFLNGFSAVSFVISPDRQWMAYTEYPSETLWKSRLDGSEALQLTKSPAYWEQWSPDSESIVYSDWHKLYRVSAQGGPAKKLIASGDYEIAPTWKPDGKSIYFNYFDPARQPKGILVVDLATGNVSPLPGGEPYYGASWSPDGHYLVALAQNPLRMMIYSAETKTWRVLKTFDIPEGLWIWSHDSKSIYMAILEDQKGMYRLGVPDGTWEQVAGLENIDSTDIEGFPSLTSDGQPVIMSHTGISQLYFLRWRP